MNIILGDTVSINMWKLSIYENYKYIINIINILSIYKWSIYENYQYMKIIFLWI